MVGINEKTAPSGSTSQTGSSKRTQSSLALDGNSNYQTPDNSGDEVSRSASKDDNKNVRFTSNVDDVENDVSSKSTETSDNSQSNDEQDGDEDKSRRRKRKAKVSFTHLRNNGEDGDDETFIKKIINNLTGNQGGLVPG